MRRGLWIAGASLALLVALLALVAALLFSDTGLRALARGAGWISGGAVAVEGLTGHLGTPLTARQLRITTDTQRITLSQLRLEWQPQALWQRRLTVNLIASERVRIEVLKAGPPPRLPGSLRLPLDVRIAVFDIAHLDWVNGDSTLPFQALRGRLDGTGGRYRLDGTATTPWATTAVQLALDQDAPFRLRGRVEATRAAELSAEATLQLGGTLSQLDFQLAAQAQAMRFTASGQAAPFAAIRLPQLVVAGQGIDPAQWSPGAPQADLAFSGVFQGQAGERLLGTFSLGNRIPGRLDAGRLPLANLVGAVVGDSRNADVSDLRVDLGAGGSLSGAGRWEAGRFALNLAGSRLDLAALHGQLAPTQMTARLQLLGNATQQTLTAEVSERWGQGDLTLVRDAAELQLRQARFSGPGGRLDARGQLELDTSRAFALQVEARDINPSRFGQFPRARLNLQGTVQGALLPQLMLRTQFTLPPGELEGYPVTGQGRLNYAQQRLADADLRLNLAGNRAQVRGAYGHVGDKLNWRIDAPALGRLNRQLAGRLSSTGSVSGNPRQPDIRAVFNASALRLPGGLAAESLSGDIELQASRQGVFNAQIDARKLQLGERRVNLLRADLRGRRDAHALSLDVRAPEGRLTAALQGGLEPESSRPDAHLRWRGQLQTAEVQGDWPMTLRAPATLLLGRDAQQIANLNFTLAGGELNLMQLDLAHAGTPAMQFATRGRFSQLPLAPLLARMEEAPATTDLRLNGDWNLRLGNTLDGEMHLTRHSGDVRMTDPALNLGLTALTLKLAAEASRVQATLDIDTREAGQARLSGDATLQRVDGMFTLPRSAPLAWTAQIDVPDLRAVRPFLPLGIRADARLNARLSGSGSLAAPRIDGTLDASALRFAWPEQGVSITDGTLKLVLADDRVRVQAGELKGTRGRVVVSGEAQWRNPQAGLTLSFEQFALTQRSDRRVTVSGITQLALDPQRLQLTGELTADRARLEMPESSRPTLASDVTVVGQPPRPPTASTRLPLALDLMLNLGDDFLFKGAGIDAQLGGRLRVFTVNDRLRGEGSIQVVKGRYAAYAQTLDIERGQLRFVGPLDNPGLDILAVRTLPTVKAGVQVRGTVQRPVVTLYSDPALPDTEKLAWLVLGRGLDGAGQQEFVLLQVAAGALLSQTESVNFQARLAETLHIDSFDVRSGDGEDLATTVVSVGKRLSSRATLSYEQSLDGLNQVVKVLYQLSPRVRLEAQAGQRSSFDAFYTREYD